MGVIKLVVPTINVNDEKATLGSKEVENLELVKKGQVLCCFETSKATEDFVSEYDGYVVWLYDEYEEIKIGKEFCYIYDTLDEAKNHKIENKAPQLPEGFMASKKAIEYAASIGFDITQIQKKGMIKTEDIGAYLNKKKTDDVKIEEVNFIWKINTKRVAVLGAGRGSMQVLDLINSISEYTAVAIYDDTKELQNTFVDSIPVVGTIDYDRIASDYNDNKFDYIVNGIGYSCEFRKKCYDALTDRGVKFCNLIHPSVIIGGNVSLGSGNIILPMCHIGPHATIGNDCFVTAQTSIEHHNIIGSHCMFGPGVKFSGSVTVGDCTRFGAGIFVEPHISIGSNCAVASGAILIKNVPSDSIVRTKISTEIIPHKQ